MMTKVAILAEPTDTGITYLAVAGQQRSTGATPGQAFDALAAQLPEDQTGTMIIVQCKRPDDFFTPTQRARLEELMSRWRALRDANAGLGESEQAELQSLIEQEIRAATERRGGIPT